MRDIRPLGKYQVLLNRIVSRSNTHVVEGPIRDMGPLGEYTMLVHRIFSRPDTQVVDGRTSGGSQGADPPSRQAKGAHARETRCGASTQCTPRGTSGPWVSTRCWWTGSFRDQIYALLMGAPAGREPGSRLSCLPDERPVGLERDSVCHSRSPTRHMHDQYQHGVRREGHDAGVWRPSACAQMHYQP